MSVLIDDRWRVVPKTNRLFLYSIRLNERELARGAVASIGPGFFQAESPFAYGDWTLVASAATPKRKWLLFYDSRTGAAATAWVDRSGLLQTGKSYPHGTLTFPYQIMAADGRGCLMLWGAGFEGKSHIGFAQVLDDGTFVEWWRTERLNFPLPSGPVAALADCHIWFTNDRAPGQGSTVHLFDIKSGQFLGSRRWGARIRWMVVDGDLLFLYFADSLRTTELCVVEANRQITTLKRTEFNFAEYPDGFNRIASTPGAHLQYEYQAYQAPGWIRVLTRDGFRLSATLSKMDWRWHYFIPC